MGRLAAPRSAASNRRRWASSPARRRRPRGGRSARACHRLGGGRVCASGSEWAGRPAVAGAARDSRAAPVDREHDRVGAVVAAHALDVEVVAVAGAGRHADRLPVEERGRAGRRRLGQPGCRRVGRARSAAWPGCLTAAGIRLIRTETRPSARIVKELPRQLGMSHRDPAIDRDRYRCQGQAESSRDQRPTRRGDGVDAEVERCVLVVRVVQRPPPAAS